MSKIKRYSLIATMFNSPHPVEDNDGVWTKYDAVREQQVQELVKGVSIVSLLYDDVTTEWECPLCNNTVLDKNTKGVKPIDAIKHAANCAYLIAKELLDENKS